MTAANPSTFDRYFQLGIEGLLSEVEFSNDRLLPKSEFIQKINSLCLNPDTAKELRQRLLRIKDFDSKEDFESILEAILFIANTNNPYSGEGFWGYEGYNIGELLGRKDIVSKFYDNNGQKYKNYLEVLLLAKEIKFNSTNELVVSLLKRENYYIEAIFSKDDLSLILLTYLERIIANSTKLTPDLWWHYITAFIRRETPELQNNTTNISYPINDKATELIKEFILRKDIDGFIRRIAIHKPMPPDDNYVLSGLIDAVFGTKEEFYQILKVYDGTSQYKDEFLKFVEDFNDATDKMRYGYMFPASYFKVIPVKKGFLGD